MSVLLNPATTSTCIFSSLLLMYFFSTSWEKMFMIRLLVVYHTSGTPLINIERGIPWMLPVMVVDGVLISMWASIWNRYIHRVYIVPAIIHTSYMEGFSLRHPNPPPACPPPWKFNLASYYLSFLKFLAFEDLPHGNFQLFLLERGGGGWIFSVFCFELL